MSLYRTLAGMLAIVCCGNGAATGITPSSADIITALDKTNLSSSDFPWNGRSPDVLKRWDLPVPVKTNGDAQAEAAMNEIELNLGQTIFDRTTIAATPDNQIATGLIISRGTAFIPPDGDIKTNCGNVAAAPNDGGWPSSFLNAAAISTKLYINLDGPGCKASLDVAIHEFGHALGMGNHFKGFGDGTPISYLFWRVLRTIYTNPIGAQRASVVVSD